MKKIIYLLLFIVILITNGCVKKEDTIKNSKEVSIIAQYNYMITGMCSQNCEDIILGPYKLTKSIKGIDEFIQNKIIWALGKPVQIKELPRIAGPSQGGVRPGDPNEKMITNKLKIKNYKEIDLFNFSISSEELSNYLNYKDAKFNIKFINPLNEELKLKIQINEKNKFQYVTLKPMETKNIQYIYKGNIVKTYHNDNNKIIKRKNDDALPLVILNDFIDYNYFNNYNYQKEISKIDDFKQYLEVKYGDINKTLVLIYHHNIILDNLK
ncbi:hypothetical protein K8R66_03135 [bacterium]|nr:hypothetical protein [bacterium]